MIQINKLKSNRKGISLVEVIVTVAIFAIIIPVIYSIFFVGNKSFETSRDIGLAHQEARIVAEYLDNELRYAIGLTDKDSTIPKDKVNGYYSIKVEKLNNNSNKKTILKLVAYDKDGNEVATDSKEIYSSSYNWDINLINGNGIIKGTIAVKDGEDNKTVYELPINIPLENDKGTAFTGSTNIIYYAAPEYFPDVSDTGEVN